MANIRDLKSAIMWISDRPDKGEIELRVVDFLQREIDRRELEVAVRRRSKHTGQSKGECRNAIRRECDMEVP